ncbi:MAG: hypothetical protein V9G19_22730 [Tetrasphaera sp.]
MSIEVEARFEDLVMARAPALLRLGLMLTGNLADAEDLVQITLLQAHRHHAQLVEMDAEQARTELFALINLAARPPGATPVAAPNTDTRLATSFEQQQYAERR